MLPRIPLRSVLFLLAAGTASVSGQPASPSGSSTRTPPPSRTSLAKGVLPDPALLDGSALAAEKRPEHGMLGEFEIPGDENATGDKVGATGENPPPPGGGGGSQDPKDQSKNAQGGGGGAPPPDGAAQAAGGGGAEGSQGQQAGGSQGGTQGGSGGAKGDPSAKAEGMQVAELGGDASGGQAGGSAAASSRPQQMAIGDKAMQIQPQAASPNVVGAQQQVVGKDVPQQYDARTPGGGKQSGGGRGNQGVEKGRVMPSGI